MQSGYIASSTGTSPSFEMAPPPTQFAPYPTQSAEGAVVPVPPQTEDDDDDSVNEIISETKPRGPVGDYVVDSGKNGTSGMLNHIRKYCRYYPANVDKTQKIISGDKSQGNKLVARGFVQTDVLEACAEMIIIHELPFSFVEKKGFRKFCSVACPLFNVPSKRTIVRQFLKMYDEYRLKLKKDLRETRVCLTTDTWTSVQNCNYMVLTAHFIDSEWKMHKRVLNFCVISNHQGPTIGKLIENCLLEWGIEKVLAITVDNASANKVAINWVRSKLNRRAKAEPVLQGKYLHVRCLAHITNLIVVSGLKRLSKSILAIRNAVRYVRSSPQRLEFFKTCVEVEGLSIKGMVCMDVPTRWNSTFIMLDAALKYKKAFVRMREDEESPFLAYFKEPEHEVDEDGVVVSNTKHIRVIPPSEDDWENATVFVKFLWVFYEVTLKLNGPKYPVLAAIAKDILKIQVSTMASESCFSTGGRGDDICTNLEDEPTPEEYEFYESVELEYASTEAAATSTNTFAATSTNTFGADPKGKGHAI
ncbi:hypothetical protein CerSpe_172420 [Prunus speciosa]